MKIDKCICYDRSFRRIYKEASECGIDTLENVQSIMNICNKCKLCNPYIKEMFKTGQKEFNKIIT
jgi:bacterioferritin-associated ferredoxin